MLIFDLKFAEREKAHARYQMHVSVRNAGTNNVLHIQKIKVSLRSIQIKTPSQ